MTKRDFELIAAAVVRSRGTPAPADASVDTRNTDRVWNAALDVFAADVADRLESVNPRFDRSRFLEACGVA